MKTLDQLPDGGLDTLVSGLQAAGNQWGARLEIGVDEIYMWGASGSSHTVALCATTPARLRAHWQRFIEGQSAFKRGAPMRVRGFTATQMVRLQEEVSCLETAVEGLRAPVEWGRTYVESTPEVLAGLADRCTLMVEAIEADPEAYVDDVSGMSEAQFNIAAAAVARSYRAAATRIYKALRQRGQ